MSGVTFNLRKHTGFKRLLFAVLLATGFTYLLSQLYLHNAFVMQKTPVDHGQIYKYHDFDNDGYSEILEFRERAPSGHYIYIRNRDGGLIDQTNYREPADPNHIMYKDITGDRFDDIFAITQREDSVFLYIHDIAQKTTLYNRLLLYKDSHPVKERRAMGAFLIGLADPRLYPSRVFLFALRNGSIPSYLPRSVFAYDLDQQKLIGEFKTHSALADFFLLDMNGDGIDEIIVTGTAFGNIHHPAKYRDDRCWLFVLDQHLRPVFEPFSLLEYPAGITCVPIEAGSEKFLLVMGSYNGDKNLPSLMYLIDGQGRIRLHKPNPFHDFYMIKPAVDYATNPSVIYGWKGPNFLIKLDHRLETIRETVTSYEKIRTICLSDLDADGQKELLCQSGDLLLAFNTDLQLRARLPGVNALWGYRKGVFKLTGPGNPVEMGFHLKDDFYQLNYTRNKLYPFIPLIFIGLVIGGFLLLTGLSQISLRMNIFRQFFKLSFFNSAEGLLIVDPAGKLLYCNTYLARLLNLPHQPAKGDKINTILRPYPLLMEKISSAMAQKQTCQEHLVLHIQDHRQELHLVAEPLRFLLQSGSGCLIRLSEIKPEQSSPKIQVWSRAVQKMAHDIKTPLSTVTLNLKALQMRLDNLKLPETERNDLDDDIRMMHSELENIQTMTRNFLKFSNLDRPHFQAFDITDVINAAIEKYRPYLSRDLEIQTDLDHELKPVWADPQQIDMVFHILLENALAAVQGRGLISISATLAQFLETSFAEVLEIEVADTGPGIKDEDKTRIFEPYFTTKQAGTGMGLAIAKKIIEDHGCSIEVHSKANFGAVFRFTLPVLTETEKHE